jgi:hypothetical protein
MPDISITSLVMSMAVFDVRRITASIGNMYVDRSVNVVTGYQIRVERTRVSRETVTVLNGICGMVAM